MKNELAHVSETECPKERCLFVNLKAECERLNDEKLAIELRAVPPKASSFAPRRQEGDPPDGVLSKSIRLLRSFLVYCGYACIIILCILSLWTPLATEITTGVEPIAEP